MRFLYAYWVTLRVIGSYLWLRFMAIFRGEVYLHEMLHDTHIRNARRIQKGIVRLQGLFIKVGQLFSIMTNFLPDAFRHELEGLQDAVPPRPYSSIRARLKEEFSIEPEQLFASIEEEPLAAASISQVHVAYLKSGEKVAVKVQYPDIDEMVHQDLKTFRRILQIVNFFVPTRGLDVVYREVSQMLLAELDFHAEAKNIDTIGQNFADYGDDRIAVPTVFPDYCSQKVLTTAFVPGWKVSDINALKNAGHNLHEIAQRLAELYCRQIFRDGIYHADPHPGNVLIDAEGKITLLDFGAVAKVGPDMRRGIAHFLQAVLSQNTEQIASALKEMGFISRTHGDEVFDQVVAYFHEKFQESITLESFNLNDIKVDPERGLEHLLALRQMDIGIGELSSAFQIPREWILLERTLLLLTGLCTLLDPQIKPMELIRPYLKEFVLGDEGEWSDFVVTTGKELLLHYFGLPAELRKFLNKAGHGRLEVRVRGLAESNRALYVLGHQMIYTAIGLTSAVLAAVFYLNGDEASFDTARLAAGASGLVLLLSMWRQSRRNKKK
ncbi:MAG TPA: AarF/ABC1/UbiB kinase family protein [Myxococcales bacterium]|nr:AarF/ABC1/UbiB kinase family protein [Myxococcales bacterium]HIN86597.1 AarF/ABC1/UbiB kinase family protein [Myxococcales bacterium]